MTVVTTPCAVTPDGGARSADNSTAAAYVPLSFAPGEAYQFDWSHEVFLLNGVTVIVKAAHVRLCHSRMLFVRCIRARRRRWCSTPTTGIRPVQGHLRTRHLRQYEDAWRLSSSAKGVSTIAASCRCVAITSSTRSLARRHQAGRRPGREPGWARPGALLHATAAVQNPR